MIISNYFYKTSGIYQRICNYFATMYRYDWYVVPEVFDESILNEYEKYNRDLIIEYQYEKGYR